MKTALALPLLLLACSPPPAPPPPDSGVVVPAEDAGVDAGIEQSFDAGVVDPGIISIIQGDSFQSEPVIGSAPNGTRLVAWLSYPASVGRYQVSYAVSKDEGRTFGKPKLAPTPDGLWGRSPSVASARDGVWLAWPAIHIDGNGARDDVHMMASFLPATDTNVAPALVLDDESQQVRYGPSIVVLDSGTLVASYVEAVGVVVARRDTAGALTHAKMTDAALTSLCTNGRRVYAVYENGTSISLQWSDDEGQTWPAAQSNVITRAATRAGVQPRCAATSDTVWVVYGLTDDAGATAAGRQELLTAVMLARSDDAAATFAEAIDVKPRDVGAMLPNLAASSGAAYVAFYTGMQSGDHAGQALLVRVGKAGVEGSAVARSPITFTTARQPPNWQGDVLGVSVSGSRVDVAYADDTMLACHVGVWGIEGDALKK